MVKGVNRRIIEINETGNEMFEKIVLYVTPKYSRQPTKYLRTSAEDLIDEYDLRKSINIPIRKTVKKRKIIRFLFVSTVVLAVVGISFLIIL